MITISAPAKVNLYLHVLNKQPDSFHQLESLVVFTEFGDKVSLSFAKDARTSFKVEGPFAHMLSTDDNLILKALALFEKEMKIQANYSIFLEKNIPVAAGLGGGSADAAAVLNGLWALHDLDMNSKELKAIAAQLGADVPMCLTTSPKLVWGIGHDEKSVTIKNKKNAILLINPQKPLSTASIFQTLGRGVAPPIQQEFLQEIIDLENIKTMRNDLEVPAFSLMPELKTYIEELQKTRNLIFARMTGSGATCFGIYQTREDAKQAEKQVKKQFTNLWTCCSYFYEESSCQMRDF